MSGWSIPPRWNAAGPGRQPADLTWPDGPHTGLAPATRATSGGLRLHLLTTLHGLPVSFALAGAKADERQVLLDIMADPALTAGVMVRVLQRILALTAAIWHNDHTG